MNFKGFNLFSIIVAAVLLMIGTVLISTLVSTEDKTSSEIYIMTNNFNLSDAASLARADAIQSFNYNFRKQLQNYLTFSEIQIRDEPGFSILNTSMTSGDPNTQFNNIVREFENVVLLTDPNSTDSDKQFDAAIRFVSENTIRQFHDGRYGKYYISLSDKSNTAVVNTQRAISEAINNSSIDGEPFLNVVGCNGYDCPVGTFYFNIPLDKIDPQTYEQLPKIIVKDIITNEELKIGLLPKSNLKIYIPLRFFKAVHHAKNNLETLKILENDFERAKLGFCDNSCVPREHPLDSARGNEWTGSVCIAERTLSGRYAGISSYSTGGSAPGGDALNAFIKEEICRNYYEFLSPEDDTFKNNDNVLKSDRTSQVDITNCPYFRVETAIYSDATKRLEGTTGNLLCTQIREVRADVVFVETDPLYMIDGENLKYKIRVRTRALNQGNNFTISGSCKTGPESGTNLCAPV